LTPRQSLETVEPFPPARVYFPGVGRAAGAAGMAGGSGLGLRLVVRAGTEELYF
jgi:hypothetical protein